MKVDSGVCPNRQLDSVPKCLLYLSQCDVFGQRPADNITVLLAPQKDELYLNLVLDFVPETVYRVIRHHSKNKQIMPILYTKVWCGRKGGREGGEGGRGREGGRGERASK